jgi:hypothetical protein
MKVSVSLPEDDIDFLDHYAKKEGYESRSAVVHKAVRLLRASGMKRPGVSGRPVARTSCGSPPLLMACLPDAA